MTFTIVCLFLAVPWVGLQCDCVIPDHTQLRLTMTWLNIGSVLSTICLLLEIAESALFYFYTRNDFFLSQIMFRLKN